MFKKYLILLTLLGFMLLSPPSLSHAQTAPQPVEADTILKQIQNGEPVNYNDVEIAGTLNLSGVLPGSTVQAPITITKSRFKGALIAKNVTFKKAVDFSETTFEGETAGFSLATFKEKAVFRKTTFVNPVDFSYANFLGSALFVEAVFQQVANFENSQYWTLAAFNGADFTGFADFFGAHFCVTVIRATTVPKECLSRLYPKTLPKIVSVDFSHAHFQSDVSFAEAHFLNASAPVNDANPKPSYISFLFARFDGDTTFDKAHFYNVTFARAHFQGTTSFRWSQFRNIVFTRSVLNVIDLDGASITSAIDLTQTNYSVLKTINFDFGKLPSGELVDLRDMLKQLEDNFRTTNQLVLSQKAYYERRQVERVLEADQLTLQANLLRWVQDQFEKYVGDYVRLDIPLATSGLLVVFGFLIYGFLVVTKQITITPAPASPQGIASSSILIRLLTITVPVRLKVPTPSGAVSNDQPDAPTAATATPSNQIPNKQLRRGCRDLLWDTVVGVAQVVRFSLRVYNDALGGNLEAVCKNRWVWIAIVLIAYLNRFLGLALTAGLTITLTNVVPAVRTLFG